MPCDSHRQVISVGILETDAISDLAQSHPIPSQVPKVSTQIRHVPALLETTEKILQGRSTGKANPAWSENILVRSVKKNYDTSVAKCTHRHSPRLVDAEEFPIPGFQLRQVQPIQRLCSPAHQCPGVETGIDHGEMHLRFDRYKLFGDQMSRVLHARAT